MRDFCLRARTNNKLCEQRHRAPELGWACVLRRGLVMPHGELELGGWCGAPVEGLPASGLAYLVGCWLLGFGGWLVALGLAYLVFDIVRSRVVVT